MYLSRGVCKTLSCMSCEIGMLSGMVIHALDRWIAAIPFWPSRCSIDAIAMEKKETKHRVLVPSNLIPRNCTTTKEYYLIVHQLPGITVSEPQFHWSTTAVNPRNSLCSIFRLYTSECYTISKFRSRPSCIAVLSCGTLGFLPHYIVRNSCLWVQVDCARAIRMGLCSEETREGLWRWHFKDIEIDKPEQLNYMTLYN